MSGVVTTMVPVERIRPNPDNPNRQTQRVFQATVDSIKEFGFVDPVIVREFPDGDSDYELIGGEHRWRAALELDMDEIPAVNVGAVDDTFANRLMIVLNETHGRADMQALSALVSGLEKQLGDIAKVTVGIPWTEAEVRRILKPVSREPQQPHAHERNECALVLKLSHQQRERFDTLVEMIQRETGSGTVEEAVMEAMQHRCRNL